MFDVYENEVVTVLTLGGEIVGRLKQSNDQFLQIEDPRLFVSNQDGSGFAPGICMTGVQTPKSTILNLSTVITVQPSHNDVKNGWLQQTTGIIL
jgi:hypothetical protein